MLLNHGETIALQEWTWEVMPERAHGILFLTSKRLVFERHDPGGFLRPGVVSVSADVTFDLIRNVSVVHAMFGRPKLQVESFRGRSTFEVSDAVRWMQNIVEARAVELSKAPTKTLSAANPKEPERIVEPPSPPHKYSPPREAPIPVTGHVVMFPCPYCRTPQPANSVKCEICGAPLRKY